eukprot:scaffold3939_cov173-Skeletonema_dohrnii-CCMP3373.AAC.2
MMNHHRRRNRSFFITTSELKVHKYESSLNDALENLNSKISQPQPRLWRKRSRSDQLVTAPKRRRRLDAAHTGPPRICSTRVQALALAQFKSILIHGWSSGCSEIADEDPNAEEYVETSLGTWLGTRQEDILDKPTLSLVQKGTSQDERVVIKSLKRGKNRAGGTLAVSVYGLLLRWSLEYWSRRISLSDRGLKWAFATLGLTYLDCYRSESYDFTIDTSIKSVLKVIELHVHRPGGNMMGYHLDKSSKIYVQARRGGGAYLLRYPSTLIGMFV